MVSARYVENLHRDLDEQFGDVSHVFIDYDGVVIDTEHFNQEAYTILLRRYGVEFTKQTFIETCFGNPPSVNGTRMIEEYSLPTTLDEYIGEGHVSILDELLEGNYVANWFIKPLVSWATDRKIVLNMISANIESRIWYGLEQLDIAPLFTEVYSLQGMDPTPSKADVIRDLVGENVSRVLIVEDSPKALQQARNVGMKTVGVRHSYNQHLEIEADIVLLSDELMSI